MYVELFAALSALLPVEDGARRGRAPSAAPRRIRWSAPSSSAKTSWRQRLSYCDSPSVDFRLASVSTLNESADVVQCSRRPARRRERGKSPGCTPRRNFRRASGLRSPLYARARSPHFTRSRPIPMCAMKTGTLMPRLAAFGAARGETGCRAPRAARKFSSSLQLPPDAAQGGATRADYSKFTARAARLT